jgi:hypothetical protein
MSVNQSKWQQRRWFAFLVCVSLLTLWFALVVYLQAYPFSSLSSIQASTSMPGGGSIRSIVVHPKWTVDLGKLRLIFFPMSGRLIRDCTPHAYSGVARTFVYIPLWIPLLLLTVLTGLRVRWRRIPPDHCQRCRYDLTGNTSGVCPELTM